MLDRKQRILAEIRRHPAPTRRSWQLRAVSLLGVSAALTLTIFLAAGGVRQEPRPPELILATASGAVCIATLAIAGLLGRGRVGLGRPRPTLIALMIGTPLLLLAWKWGWSATSPANVVPWPDRPGLRCLGLSFLTGLPLLLALTLLWRDRDPVHGTLTGAAMGVAAGACSWVMVDLWCPVAYVPHLLLGHLLPMVWLALMGSILGWKVISLREQGTVRASAEPPPASSGSGG